MPATALVITDMLNPYDFEDADALAVCVEERLPSIVDLRDRGTGECLVVYVNDNYDRWEDQPDDLIKTALEGRHPELVEPIAPEKKVPFIPKGRHSIFYQTPLEHLLGTHDIKRLVLAGQVTEQCILYSALDAYLRGFDLTVPTDAVVHLDPELGDAALKMMERNMHAELCPGADVF